MPKDLSNIVVRPVKRGATMTSKVVLGTMSELNHHAPLAEIAPYLVYEDPKPWKQPSRPVPQRRRSMRRNAGRNDGRTWVSPRFVCGVAEDADWDLDLEDLGDAADELVSEYVGETRPQWRVEVDILDIAKPAKLRGTSHQHGTVRMTSGCQCRSTSCPTLYESMELERRTQEYHFPVLRA